MKEPLISILIPCYNGEQFIDQCLKTVVDQTYKNIEIIVLNDGSTDKSWNVLELWRLKDDRIKLYSQLNVGLSETRNRLIDYANGEYFSFLDIDDTFEKRSIEYLYNKSLEGKADIVVGRTAGVYKDGNLKLPYIPVWRRKREMSNLHYVKSNICTPWSSIIRLDFFKKLEEGFLPKRVFEDIGLMPYLYLKAENFVAINETTYNYYKYNSSSSSISNFKNNAFLKRNDLLANTEWLLRKFKSENWDRKSDYKIAINGILFEILLANNILINNFTKDKKIYKLLKYNVYKLLESFGWRLKFSKTPWKALGYIYLRLSYNIKFFKNGIIFKKTFQSNLISNYDPKKHYKTKQHKLNVYLFKENMLFSKDMKNKILEISEVNFFKHHSLINKMKLKYILINVKDTNYNKFHKYLDYKNIYGITVKSSIFETRILKNNEDFLIVNIEYEHIDDFSRKKLLNQLNQLNVMLRRPLIFLKCKWDKNIIRQTKNLVDLIILADDKNLKIIKINNSDLLDVEQKKYI